MCRPKEEISKHDLALMKLNILMLDIEAHVLGIKSLDEKGIEKINKYADDIREDLEKCKAFGLKY